MIDCPSSRLRARRAAPCRVSGALGLALGALVVLGAAGCRGSEPASPAERELLVFAAASLRDVFTTIGADFKRAWPGVEVTFNFAGTQQLRTQLEEGAAADVFASADQEHMEALVRAGRVTGPAPFAGNEPVIVVSRERAAAIRTFADLPNARRIVVGAAEVPIGRYTARILDNAAARLGADFRAGIEAKVVSRELNVRQVLAKVSLGEADAGVVYRTDVGAAAEQLAIVPIPGDLNVLVEYPIAVVAKTAHSRLARAWVDLVLSPGGRAVLSQAGFRPPAPAPAGSPPRP